MKQCPFCNAELPDEASFCLSCASVLNCREVTKEKTKTVFFTKSKKITALCIAVFLVFALSFASLYRMYKLPLSPQNSHEPKTTLVPVTEENGETVTDVQGNTVYEAVTLEPPTEKSVFSNIIGSIFGNDQENAENEEGNETEDNTPSNATDSPSGGTETPPSSTQPSEPPATTEEEIINEDPAEVFEYKPYGKSTTKISITKYKGNASFVTVPDYINGLMVVEIKKDAFLNNSKIKTIDIVKGERTSIWLASKCFNNLSSLTTVNLYNNDLGMQGDFAVDCPIKDFNITYWQYKFVNGAIYSHNSRYWEFKTFCGNPCYTTLTLEPWCKEISNDNNLYNAKNLKVINAHRLIAYMPLGYDEYHENLQAINVEDGNELNMSVDGVLFHRSSTDETCYYCYYPYSKKDKTFTLPKKEGYTFTLASPYYKSVNPYIEELYIPLNASYSLSCNNFSNLKKLNYEKGHPDYDEMRLKFMGEMTLY